MDESLQGILKKHTLRKSHSLIRHKTQDLRLKWSGVLPAGKTLPAVRDSGQGDRLHYQNV